jgi:hypothetical protein
VVLRPHDNLLILIIVLLPLILIVVLSLGIVLRIVAFDGRKHESAESPVVNTVPRNVPSVVDAIRIRQVPPRSGRYQGIKILQLAVLIENGRRTTVPMEHRRRPSYWRGRWKMLMV